MKLTPKIPLAFLLLGTTLASWAQNNPPVGCVTSVTNCYMWFGPTNSGAMSYDATNICVGGGVTPPSVVSNLNFPPFSFALISYSNSCTATNWVTSMPVTYTPGPLYWVPPIPASFPACGVYTFMPMENGIPSWSGWPVLTNFVGNGGNYGGDEFWVTVLQGTVDAVDWVSDYIPFYSYSADYNGDGGTTTFSRPVWQLSPAVNNPVIQPANTTVTLEVTINVCPAGQTYSLIGTSSEAGLCFTNAIVNSTGSDQTEAVRATVWLRTNLVDIVSAPIYWFVLPQGSSSLCYAGMSGPHKIYVTWADPSTYGGNTATLKRIDKVCTVAHAAASEAAIGNLIGPQATSGSLFGGNSIFGNPPTLTNAWAVLDGNDADCATLSTLMKQELDLLGAADSAVKLVYARLGPDNSGWTGVVQDSPPSTGYYVYRVPGNYSTRLGYVAGNGFNNYEGCCLFQGKYWMGGLGTSRTSAAGVLHYVADPNTSSTAHHQCYYDQQNQFVPYPNPPEPTY